MKNNQQAGNKRRSKEAEAIWGARRVEIVQLYRSKGWSQAALAERYGVTLSGMQQAMKRLGIKPKSRGRTGEANGRYKHGRASTLYRKMIQKTECSVCGATENLCVHHKNGDHLDNRTENLDVMCMPCHSRMHKQEWWDAQR